MGGGTRAKNVQTNGFRKTKSGNQPRLKNRCAVGKRARVMLTDKGMKEKKGKRSLPGTIFRSHEVIACIHAGLSERVQVGQKTGVIEGTQGTVKSALRGRMMENDGKQGNSRTTLATLDSD